MARLLGLELRPSGGAALEKLARQGDDTSVRFSLPLRKFKDCNFSYAGTKTAVRLAIESKLPEGPTEDNLQACMESLTVSAQPNSLLQACNRQLDSIPSYLRVKAFGLAAQRCQIYPGSCHTV